MRPQNFDQKWKLDEESQRIAESHKKMKCNYHFVVNGWLLGARIAQICIFYDFRRAKKGPKVDILVQCIMESIEQDLVII